MEMENMEMENMEMEQMDMMMDEGKDMMNE